MEQLSIFDCLLDELDLTKPTSYHWELVNYCEFDKFASKSYSIIHDVDESMNLGDITKVDETQLPDFDLMTYGFPCQSFSMAGKRLGFDDPDKGDLFFHSMRIAKHCKPKVMIAENVKGLVNHDNGNTYRTVIETLEYLGYNNYAQVLNTKDYGIPQNRERIFIVSIRKDVDNEMFQFPRGFKLELRLKDLLESEIDKKYYLSDNMINYVKSRMPSGDNKLNIGMNINNFNDDEAIAGTICTTGGSQPNDNFITYGAVYYDRQKGELTDKILQVGNLYPENDRNPEIGRVYDSSGLSPTLSAMQGGQREPKIMVKSATSRGYEIANDGDSVNLAYPELETRRGRVGKGVAQTLTTSDNMGVVEPIIVASRGRNVDNPNDRTPGIKVEQRLEPNSQGLCNTLTTVQKDNYVLEPTLRIRKLTPKEVWRLQGFDDSDIDKCIDAGLSDTQLYKQAGNSITVDVMYNIFVELHRSMPMLFEDLRVLSLFSGIGAFEKALTRLYEELKGERKWKKEHHNPKN